MFANVIRGLTEPLLAWSLLKYARISVSGWLQFAVAVLIFLAGHAALTIWPHR
jgi:hypothetical protein